MPPTSASLTAMAGNEFSPRSAFPRTKRKRVAPVVGPAKASPTEEITTVGKNKASATAASPKKNSNLGKSAKRVKFAEFQPAKKLTPMKAGVNLSDKNTKVDVVGNGGIAGCSPIVGPTSPTPGPSQGALQGAHQAATPNQGASNRYRILKPRSMHELSPVLIPTPSPSPVATPEPTSNRSSPQLQASPESYAEVEPNGMYFEVVTENGVTKTTHQWVPGARISPIQKFSLVEILWYTGKYSYACGSNLASISPQFSVVNGSVGINGDDSKDGHMGENGSEKVSGGVNEAGKPGSSVERKVIEVYTKGAVLEVEQ
ncbi:uncharacterized protein BDR25DRAFT_312800 [Lindgomyces ingoldianus]|uniref:Uncharacterized protein n=1 Tax=Lindgomyces ingoldianus TaxID=673940 RepID=A0ACB6R278_9PLEO|nr:uncharacterized protein BDR25DRAFT_312800 [Lindgomyces ingoldianus]KAF2472928.1 hypothetical protein BDR25DRAFT_312800 [Lindgomyces ingoldianus]